MSKHPERAQDYLGHVLTALERIQQYAMGKAAEEFMADTLLQDAILRNLGIIGEAAHRLSAMRNRITHAYENVDLAIVWNLVLFDVPDLRAKITAALEELRKSDV